MNLKSPDWLTKSCLHGFQKSSKEESQPYLRGMMFQREEATTEKALFLDSIRSTSLIDGTCNIPCLPTLIGWENITSWKWKFLFKFGISSDGQESCPPGIFDCSYSHRLAGWPKISFLVLKQGTKKDMPPATYNFYISSTLLFGVKRLMLKL